MICRALMVLCATPLAIYPGVFLAAVMALASPPSPNANPLTVAVAKAFCWTSLLYPIVYMAGVAVSRRSAVTGAAIAVGNLLLCVVLFAAWYLFSGGER